MPMQCGIYFCDGVKDVILSDMIIRDDERHIVINSLTGDVVLDHLSPDALTRLAEHVLEEMESRD